MSFHSNSSNDYLAHPDSSELTAYCEKWFYTPEEVEDEELIQFERHCLQCDNCASFLHMYEEKLRAEMEANSPKTMTMGGG